MKRPHNLPDRRDVLQGALVLPALVLAGTAAAGAPDPLDDPQLRPGIALALAQRRASQISHIRYDITLDLTGPDRASGTVTIAFDRVADSGNLVLDFRGPVLADLVVNGQPVVRLVRHNDHLLLPESMLRAGANSISARFETPIAAAGAAIIRFRDASDGQTYLYTLLVPSDANLLFPCFDQPDLKARVSWHLVAPAGWTVLANGPLAEKQDVGATTHWHFAESAPIPTYLAAFAAGPWATWTSAPAGAQPITLHARASRRQDVDAAVQLATNRAALDWLARWFGVPFPFAKLDLLLAPAFPFGGMEHVGAVFYNEDSFVWREPPTLPRRLRRDQTIYHEISHQWFGDDVTMRWFDDLWLKEGFATYMAARIQADLQPDSQAWTTFLLSIKTPAYRADASLGTQPLWQALDNLDAAKSNYGPIVYNKAPAVIKQLAHFVGEAGFRAGLHAFLLRHALGNATWRDLLDAVGAASGVDLAAFGRAYVLRAGMPRIDTQIDLVDGRIAALTLVQRPARALPGDQDSGPSANNAAGEYWPMKLRVRLGYAEGADVVLDAVFQSDRVTVPGAAGRPAPDYVWANDDDQGYGLFLPDDRSVAWIAANVGSVRNSLLRAMLWGALWDVVRDARFGPARFGPARFVAVVLRALPDEADEQISRTLLARAAQALDVYLPEPRARPLRPAWEAALIARSDNAALGYGLRKDVLDRLIATARTPPGQDRLRALLAETLPAPGTAQPIRQPTRWAIVQRLVTIDAPDAAAIQAAEVARDHSTEAVKDAFVARAATPAVAVKQAWFARYFDDRDLNEAWVSESLAAFNPVEQADLTLPFLRPALDRLEWIRANRRIFFLPEWIDAFIGGQVGAAALAVVDGYLAERTTLPIDVRRKILLARDELERTVRIRAA